MSISEFARLLYHIAAIFVSLVGTILTIFASGAAWIAGRIEQKHHEQTVQKMERVTAIVPQEPPTRLSRGEFVSLFIDKFTDASKLMPCYDIRHRLHECAWELYLEEKDTSFLDPLIEGYVEFIKCLPSTAIVDLDNEPKSYYVAPLQVSQDAVEQLVAPLFSQSVRQNAQFHSTRARIINNTEHLKGKGEPIEYLYGTPFQDILRAHIPLDIQSKRDLGWYICSPAGKGKTNLLTHQVIADSLTKGCIIILDSKGDLIQNVQRIKLPKKVVVIDPDPHLALNPLQIGATSTHSVGFLEYLFSSIMETKPTPLQSTLFRSIFMVMNKIPNASFATFRGFIVNGWKKYEDVIKTLDEEDQDFFFKGEYDSQTYRETKQQLLWRIRDLTTSIPLLREVFKSPVTKINMTEWMDSQNIYLINNSKQLLDDAGSEFFGRFFLAMIRAAADQRSSRRQEDKNPVRLYIDECQNVLARDEKLPGILDECRSQRIQLIAAHQRLPQIKDPNVLDALSNCGIRMANSDEDAPALASRLRTTPDHLRSLPTGTFAAFVRDLTPQGAVTLNIPFVDLNEYPKVSEAEHARRKAEFRRDYCYTPEPIPAPTPTESTISEESKW